MWKAQLRISFSRNLIPNISAGGCKESEYGIFKNMHLCFTWSLVCKRLQTVWSDNKTNPCPQKIVRIKIKCRILCSLQCNTFKHDVMDHCLDYGPCFGLVFLEKLHGFRADVGFLTHFLSTYVHFCSVGWIYYPLSSLLRDDYFSVAEMQRVIFCRRVTSVQKTQGGLNTSKCCLLLISPALYLGSRVRRTPHCSYMSTLGAPTLRSRRPPCLALLNVQQ